MTVIAVIVLVGWAAGIAAIVIALAALGHEIPHIDAASSQDPVRTCLALAVVAVFWPAVVITAGLIRLTERGRR